MRLIQDHFLILNMLLINNANFEEIITLFWKFWYLDYKNNIFLINKIKKEINSFRYINIIL